MKILKGKVISTKMQMSAVVVVEQTWRHPLYKKTVRRTKKYLVHDEKGAKEGDQVILHESRPLSKRKRWVIAEILK